MTDRHSIKPLAPTAEIALRKSIGIAEYSRTSRLATLKACANEAERVRNAFLDVAQLGADKKRTELLSSKTTEKPTRNTTVGHLKTLSQFATCEDRLLYFHSGHAVRISNELYLVPSEFEPSLASSKELSKPTATRPGNRNQW